VLIGSVARRVGCSRESSDRMHAPRGPPELDADAATTLTRPFHKLVTNRMAGWSAPRVPGAGVIVHRCRRSGREYRTPISAFRRPGRLRRCATYGRVPNGAERPDGEGTATLETGGRQVRVVTPGGSCPAFGWCPARRDILGLIGADAFLLLDEAVPSQSV